MDNAKIEALRANVEATRLESERAEAHRVEMAKLPVTVENRRPRLAAASASDKARAAHADALRALANAQVGCEASPTLVSAGGLFVRFGTVS